MGLMTAWRVLTVSVLLLIGLLTRLGVQSLNASADAMSCEDLTLARPQRGVSYTGVIQNDDYRFQVRVPRSQIGWGAASGAPFHGFAIFLDNDLSVVPKSCINFLIKQRVVLDEDAQKQPTKMATGWTPIRIGNRKGLRKATSGLLAGVAVENVIVTLELPRKEYTNDLTIWFVTPIRELSKSEPVFQSFLESFRFQ